MKWWSIKSSYATFGLIVLAYLPISLPVYSANAAPITVTIITKTTTGGPVKAIIEKRVFPSKEILPTFSTGGGQLGKVTLLEETCDNTIQYIAKSTAFGVIRDSKKTLSCSVPEVVFDDFEVTTAAILLPNEAAFRDPDKWYTLLTGASARNSAVDNKIQKISYSLASAYAHNDYGKIAIISSELASQYTAADRTIESALFESISVDAVARGVWDLPGNSADNSLVQWGTATKYSVEQAKYVLSPASKNLLEKYQVDKLGISEDSNEFGKASWDTMRSLPGGSNITVDAIQLPDNYFATAEKSKQGGLIGGILSGAIVGGFTSQ